MEVPAMPHLFCLAQKALFLAFAAIFVVGFHASAQAGPQSLGLVMTGGPVPLTCDDGVCRAVLTSFCLERDRDTPQIGTPYRVGAGEVTLLVRDGPSQHRIPAHDLLRFTSERDSHSVEIRLPQTAARSWQGVAFSLEVGRRVTLLPLSDESGDGRDPLRTAALTGPMREVGERTVDLAAPDIDAVRLLDRAVNRLPETGRGGIEQSEAVWRESISSLPGGAAPALAQNAYRTCQRKTEDSLYYSFRNCLVVSHESLIARLNERYWEAVGGS
jgi:hypothetical protein